MQGKMNVKILMVLSALATIGFLSSLVFAHAETNIMFDDLNDEKFSDCVSYEKPSHEWTQPNIDYNCILYNPNGVSVMQHNLDKDDIRTLTEISMSQLTGNYTEPPRYDWKHKTATSTTIFSFAGLKVTDEDLKAEESKANDFICSNNLYLPNFKKDNGCKLQEDGTWKYGR